LKNTIIISGVGFKPKNNNLTSDENIFNSKNVFLNIGCASAKVLAKSGYNLIILSRTEEKLKRIKDNLLELYPNVTIKYNAIDIISETSINAFFSQLDTNIEYGYVHSAGLSAGGYKIKDNNPYLEIDDIPVDLPIREYEVVVKSLLLMIRGFQPIFKRQKSSRVVVVNSLSGIRAYPLGFSHSAAKGGLHNAIRSLALELSKKNIFFSEINPGIVDTGAYENDFVIESVRKIGREFGYNYDEIPKISPIAVAEAIELCLKSEANIMTINLLPEGQWKHQGA